MSRESPSTSGITNAKSLAKIGAVLAGNRSHSILSHAGWKAAHEGRAYLYDAVTHSHVTFTQAGFACWDEEWGRLDGRIDLIDGVIVYSFFHSM
jgi:hypothetical protein